MSIVGEEKKEHDYHDIHLVQFNVFGKRRELRRQWCLGWSGEEADRAVQETRAGN